MSKRTHQCGGSAILIVFSSLTFTCGCKVGPDYIPPQYEPPLTWHGAGTDGITEGPADIQQWWTVFNDSTLEELIEAAHAQNLDLRQAYARVIEARAGVSFTAGQYWPTVDAVGFYQRSRVSQNGLVAPVTGGPDETNLNSVGLDSSWEIDVFGRIGRAVESAIASFHASVEDYRDILVSLYADVASNYIDIRSLQARIKYAQDNVEAQKGSVELTRNRYDAGLVPQLDVQQAELNLATTESAIPTLRQLESQAIYRASVLLGLPPAALVDRLSPPSEIPVPPAEVTAYLPAELMRQRPDIRRAERLLAGQVADIGVATADLYPAFSLSGVFTLQAQQINDVGNWDSRAWSFGPAFRWNLFDGNRIRSNIRIQESRAQQALIGYEQTVLLALEEVEDAMVALAEERQRLEALQRSVTAAQKSVELVLSLYRNGLTDFQNVLDTQRALAVQEDQLAQSAGLVAKNLVALYIALGGGWNLGEPDLAASVCGCSFETTDADDIGE
jgi:multidrug efflux system outer membrane protein